MNAPSIALIGAIVMLGGCDSPSEPPQPPDATITLTVVVSSVTVADGVTTCAFTATAVAKGGAATWRSGTVRFSSSVPPASGSNEMTERDVLDWWGTNTITPDKAITVSRILWWDRSWTTEHIFRYMTPRGEMKSASVTFNCTPGPA